MVGKGNIEWKNKNYRPDEGEIPTIFWGHVVDSGDLLIYYSLCSAGAFLISNENQRQGGIETELFKIDGGGNDNNNLGL